MRRDCIVSTLSSSSLKETQTEDVHLEFHLPQETLFALSFRPCCYLYLVRSTEGKTNTSLMVLMTVNRYILYHIVSPPQSRVWIIHGCQALYYWCSTLTEILMKLILLTVKPRSQRREKLTGSLVVFQRVLFDLLNFHTFYRSYWLSSPCCFDLLFRLLFCFSSLWICRGVCGTLGTVHFTSIQLIRVGCHMWVSF